MKNEIMTKVNKIGNVGQIIANIAKVVIAIGAIACLVSGIILTVLPDDMVVIHVDGKAAVEINMPMVGDKIVVDTGNGPVAVVGAVSTDAVVDGFDCMAIKDIIANDGYMAEADINKDGFVDGLDYLELAKYNAGMYTYEDFTKIGK